MWFEILRAQCHFRNIYSSSLENTDTLRENTATVICACDVTLAFWKACVFAVYSNTVGLRFQMSSLWKTLSSACVFDENGERVWYRFRSSPHKCIVEAMGFRWYTFAETPACPVGLVGVFPVHTWTLEKAIVIYTCFRCSKYDITPFLNASTLESASKCMHLWGKRWKFFERLSGESG